MALLLGCCLVGRLVGRLVNFLNAEIRDVQVRKLGSRDKLMLIFHCISDYHPIFAITQFVTQFTYVARDFGAQSRILIFF